jgi:hypothetical protein
VRLVRERELDAVVGDRVERVGKTPAGVGRETGLGVEVLQKMDGGREREDTVRPCRAGATPCSS